MDYQTGFRGPDKVDTVDPPNTAALGTGKKAAVGETGRIWTTRVIWTTPTITALDDSRAISDIRETLRLMLGIL